MVDRQNVSRLNICRVSTPSLESGLIQCETDQCVAEKTVVLGVTAYGYGREKHKTGI